MKFFLPAFALAIALSGSSCLTTMTPQMATSLYLQGVGTGPVPMDPLGIDKVSYWDGDGLTGAPSIRIRLGEQKAYFYKGGTLAGVSMIASGRENFESPKGKFKIIQKNQNHRSNLYGEIIDAYGNVINKDADIRKDPVPPGGRFVGAPMPYFMRIHGGVGMHVGFLPGYAASHGCIRMPEKMAMKFWQNAPLGTPVWVE